MEINIQKMKQLISLKNSAKIWLPAMLAIVFSVVITFAQNSGVVNGVVVDESGKRLPNASVVVKGTQQSVTSDSKGSFSIQAAMGKTLVVSYVGYATKEVLVSGNSLSVVLKEEVTTLEEVVSIGYSKLRKSDLTGAISSVKARELNLSTPTISQALVGKVAGVQVSQVSGAPYSGAKIRVRGIGSINASSEPLYVIDGYAVGGNPSQGQGNGGNSTSGFNPAANGNDIFINPDDIESIEILKDAASAAIYGSRAAAGVILITTKRGKQGKGTIEYDYQYSAQQLSNKVKLLNASEFTDLFVEGRNANYKDILISKNVLWDNAFFSDDNATRIAKAGQTATGCSVCIPKYLYDNASQKIIQPAFNTDWQDVLYNNAAVQRHNISFSGSSNNTRYFISGGYLDQPGILNSTYQKRINVRANIDADITEKLKTSASFFVTNTKNREVQEGRFNQGPILGALVYMPIFPAFNPDGSLATADKGAGAQTDGYAYAFQGIENPLALAQRVNMTRNGLRGTYNLTTTYEVVKDLFAKINLGGSTYNEKYEYYYPTNLSNGINPPGSAQSVLAANSSAQTLSSQDLLAEFTLNYKKTFRKNRFDLLGGYTAQQTNTDIIAVASKNYTNDLIPEITAGGAVPGDFSRLGNTGKSTTTLVSYLSRLVYSYDRRYFLTGSFRMDASSRFGPQNRWGKFGSVSGAWSISNESFYHNWLGKNSTLKLRASWGLTGNNNIGNYRYEQGLTGSGGNVIGGNILNAVWAGGITDAKLGWESTEQYNFGVDATLFNNRVSVLFNYYNSKSNNLLYNKSISSLSGATSILTNLSNSNISNKGFDLQLDVKAIQTKDWSVSFSGNITANRNKVVSLGGASEIQINGAERSYITHVTREGDPVGSFYGLKVAGMVKTSDMANVNSDLAVYKANGNKFPTGYQLKGFAISTYSTTPLNPGDLYFVDKNGDGIITDADKDIIGTPYPKFTYGFALNVSYKVYDLSASFNGSKGNQVIDGQDYYIRNMEGSGNQYAIVNQRYRNDANPGNGREYRASRGGSQSNSTRLSDYYLQDGSFFRCTNITFGVNISSLVNTRKLGISNLRWYTSIDNAFTITNYLGYNPEVDFNNGANLTPGVDYGKYPLVRSFNTGLKIQF
jgi:TonB-dependent starch-binding outer membrane protein SusC